MKIVVINLKKNRKCEKNFFIHYYAISFLN